LRPKNQGPVWNSWVMMAKEQLKQRGYVGQRHSWPLAADKCRAPAGGGDVAAPSGVAPDECACPMHWSLTMHKRLLNKSESVVDHKLAAVCKEWSARVHNKVRIADVLFIEDSGISGNDYSFALKSHFDFVVTDADYLPLFAVEFDG